ncbi:hypothetical protein OAK19_04345 [Aureispira]|nr:hypothetical protein [Aureispira sp.]
MDFPRYDHQMAQVNNYIYALGGRNYVDGETQDFPHPTKNVERYDTVNKKWETSKDMPVALYNFAAVTWPPMTPNWGDDDLRQIIVIGGITSTDLETHPPSVVGPTPSNKVYAMTFKETAGSESWAPSSNDADSLPEPVYGISALSIREGDFPGIYVFGKIEKKNRTYRSVIYYKHLNEDKEYDPLAPWREIPYLADHLAGYPKLSNISVINSKNKNNIHIIGGVEIYYPSPANPSYHHGKNEIYNINFKCSSAPSSCSPAPSSCSPVASSCIIAAESPNSSLIHPRINPTVGYFKDQLFVIGGVSGLPDDQVKFPGGPASSGSELCGDTCNSIEVQDDDKKFHVLKQTLPVKNDYMTGIPFISQDTDKDGSFFYFTGGISSPYSPSSISEKAYKFPDGVDTWSYLSRQNDLTNQQRCLPGNFPNCESCSHGGWVGRLKAPSPREGVNICEECSPNTCWKAAAPNTSQDSWGTCVLPYKIECDSASWCSRQNYERCSKCKPGFWSFPDCNKQCDSVCYACDPVTGQCESCKGSDPYEKELSGLEESDNQTRYCFKKPLPSSPVSNSEICILRKYCKNCDLNTGKCLSCYIKPPDSDIIQKITSTDNNDSLWKFKCPFTSDYIKYGLTPNSKCSKDEYLPVIYCKSPGGECKPKEGCLFCDDNGICIAPAGPFSPSCNPFCKNSCSSCLHKI